MIWRLNSAGIVKLKQRVNVLEKGSFIPSVGKKEDSNVLTVMMFLLTEKNLRMTVFNSFLILPLSLKYKGKMENLSNVA